MVPPHFAAAIGVAATLRPANGGDPAGLTCGSNGGVGRAVRAFFPALRRVFAVARGRLPSIGGSLCPSIELLLGSINACAGQHTRAGRRRQSAKSRAWVEGYENHEGTKIQSFLLFRFYAVLIFLYVQFCSATRYKIAHKNVSTLLPQAKRATAPEKKGLRAEHTQPRSARA